MSNGALQAIASTRGDDTKESSEGTMTAALHQHGSSVCQISIDQEHIDAPRWQYFTRLSGFQ